MVQPLFDNSDSFVWDASTHRPHHSVPPPSNIFPGMPQNFALLATYVKLLGPSYVLKKETSKKKNPKIYPLDLLLHMHTKFEWKSGNVLHVKAFQVTKSMTPIMIFFLHNQTQLPMLKDQLVPLLQKAHSDLAHNSEKDEQLIPDFAFWANFPHVPKQATQGHKTFDSNHNANKKVIHIECNQEDASHLTKLFLKKNGTFLRIFGQFPHPTMPLGDDVDPSECIALCQMCGDHTGFHASVQYQSLFRFSTIDCTVLLHHDNKTGLPSATQTSIHDLLYLINLDDGGPLFQTIIPHTDSQRVNVVVPFSEEGDHQLAQINQQAAGYVYFYFISRGFHHADLIKLLWKSCDVQHVASIKALKWDLDHKCVILPQAEEVKVKHTSLHTQSWFVGIGQLHSAPPAKEYLDPELAFPLNDDPSIQTIHNKPNRHLQPPVTLGPPSSSSMSGVHGQQRGSVTFSPKTDDSLALAQLVQLCHDNLDLISRILESTDSAPHSTTWPHTKATDVSSKGTGAQVASVARGG